MEKSNERPGEALDKIEGESKIEATTEGAKQDSGFMVIDRRGEEKAEEVKQSEKPAKRKLTHTVEVVRCPACKKKHLAKNLLVNPRTGQFVCLKCGCIFMQPEFARKLYKESLRIVKSV